MSTYRQARNICGIEQSEISGSGSGYCSVMVLADIEDCVEKRTGI